MLWLKLCNRVIITFCQKKKKNMSLCPFFPLIAQCKFTKRSIIIILAQETLQTSHLNFRIMRLIFPIRRDWLRSLSREGRRQRHGLTSVFGSIRRRKVRPARRGRASNVVQRWLLLVSRGYCVQGRAQIKRSPLERIDATPPPVVVVVA